ncbi:DUF2513 domain-containing protein [Luteibacter aegosomatis]|uniref:DUF2513 domain-containing protein n=1 Tax=Luteibacter aegosomatis TaxID=2911537 RepID=UPI001FFB326C|nr:DUF2513 domain-containing protein [Luteibacter aegosomatis]UPG86827.1 DUF2513 domain-containing protein [Luteibacter aegosomatis]
MSGHLPGHIGVIGEALRGVSWVRQQASYHREGLMKLDRDMQRSILEKAAAAFPARITWDEGDFPGVADDDLIGNLRYLEQHGLIDAGLAHSYDGWHQSIGTEITADGFDFLEGDGGLGAILGVVTIRLHEDTLKDLIAARIQEAPLEPADKKKWSDALRALPSDATKHLAMKLVDLGLSHGQDALRLLEKWFGQP